MLYNLAIRLVITYRVVAWLLSKWPRKGLVAQAIQKISNKGLCVVVGAYQATLIRELEREVFIPPIDIYNSKLYTRHIQRTYASPVSVFI